MIEVGFKTHPGLRRAKNEDACFVIPKEGIYIVADGVGGNSGGEVASRSAVNGIVRFAEKYKLADNVDYKTIYEYFQECIKNVNSEIFREANAHSENHGMATTLVVCCIRMNKAYFINIGDSRAYISRGGTLTQITRDHTYVNDLISAGIITDEEARTHSKKHVITRALGAEDTIDFDFRQIDVLPSDIILLCTDGLHGEVPDEQIESIMGSGLSMTDMSDRMISTANNAGGTDNITVVCLKIEGGSNER